MYTKKQEDYMIDRWTFLFEDNIEDEYDEGLAELISSYQSSEE